MRSPARSSRFTNAVRCAIALVAVGAPSGCSAVTGFGDLVFDDRPDLGGDDLGVPDGGPTDSGPMDTGPHDAMPDARPPDAEASVPDARIEDVGPIDCMGPEDCEDPTSCTTADCVDGRCEFMPASDGMSCDDRNACTTITECRDGVCVAVTSKTCPGASLGPCDIGVECIPATGECEVVTRPVDASCVSDDPCILEPACNELGQCTGDDTCMGIEDDDNECTVPACTPDGCAHVPVDGSCEDEGTCCDGRCVDVMTDTEHCSACGNACDEGQTCVVGACASCAGDADCDDGLSCTTDTCFEGMCERVRAANSCMIDGKCWRDGEVNPSNQCEICASTTPFDWTAATAGACDDGLYCTVGDTCNADAQCVGEPRVCDPEACNRAVCLETMDTCAQIPAYEGANCAFISACCDGECRLLSLGC